MKMLEDLTQTPQGRGGHGDSATPTAEPRSNHFTNSSKINSKTNVFSQAHHAIRRGVAAATLSAVGLAGLLGGCATTTEAERTMMRLNMGDHAYTFSKWVDHNKNGIIDAEEIEDVRYVFRRNEPIIVMANLGAIEYLLDTPITNPVRFLSFGLAGEDRSQRVREIKSGVYTLKNPDGKIVDSIPLNESVVNGGIKRHATMYPPGFLRRDNSPGMYHAEWNVNGKLVSKTSFQIVD